MTTAVSQFTTKPWSFEDDLRNYTAAGVPAIECCEAKLPKDPARAVSQLEQLRALPCPVVSVQPRVHSVFPDRMASDPKDPAERMERYKDSIRLFTRQFPDANLSFVMISGVCPDYNLREGWDAVRRLVPEVAAFAADHGARIAFESIAPEGMYADTFIHGLDQGLRVAEMVNRDNFGIVVDMWHVWQEHRLLERLEACAKKVFTVHMCDWPHEAPRGQDDRLIPGDGVIDLRAIVSALKAGGYDGPFALEVLSDKKFPDSLWKEDPVHLLRRGLAAVRDIVDKA